MAHLAYVDQASFLGLRATEMETLGQFIWIYSEGADFAGLQRFHRNLSHGLLGRRIERSRVPFGRHRWVVDRSTRGIDLESTVLERTELGAWLFRHTQLPIDPEHGPAWRLGVANFADGSTAVSLVASHSISDGVGLLVAISEAVAGVERDFGYELPRTRRPVRGFVEDLKVAHRDRRETGRAARDAARLLTNRRNDIRAAKPVAPDRPHPHLLPAASVYVSAADWDTQANLRGGTSNSLVGGFAARLAARLGRVDDDGMVTVSMPVNERDSGDTRANAMTSVMFKVDPTDITKDLTGIRAATKKVLSELASAPDEKWALLPLAPYTPRAAARRLASVALEFSDYPVGCSNVGPMDPAVNRPDGTDADFVSCKLAERRIRPDDILATYGQLFVASGRCNGQVFLSVVAYQPGALEWKPVLVELLAETLAEFGLEGVIE